MISTLWTRREATLFIWLLRRLIATLWQESICIKLFSQSTQISTASSKLNLIAFTTQLFTDQFWTSERSKCIAWIRNQSKISRSSIRPPSKGLRLIKMLIITEREYTLLSNGMLCSDNKKRQERWILWGKPWSKLWNLKH